MPDLQAWVEVKGQLEPRDDYLLKDVAVYLHRERAARLFLYTQCRAFLISAEGFAPLTHTEFWAALTLK